MQDKNKSELDPALIDNAWLQMEQQLNEAMPQKKRRAIWWWAGLAGLAILFLNIYLFGKGNEPKSLEDEFISEPAAIVAEMEHNQEPNNHELIQSVPGEDQMTVALVEEQPLLQEQGPTGTSAQTAIPFLQETPIKERDNDIENTAIHKEDPTLDPSVVAEPQSTVIIATNEIPTLENAPSKPLETPALASSEQTEAANDILETLPTSDFRLLTSDFQLPVEPTKVKPISPWHYYLEGQGGFSLSTTDYSSIAAGVGVQRDLNTKWSAELGMQYQRNQRSLLFGNNTNNDLADEFVGSLGSGYAVERSLAFQNIETTRWNLYLGGLYQCSPRVSFGLAVQGSYFTKAFAVFDNASAVVVQPNELESNNDLRVDIYDNVLSVYDLNTATNAVSDPYPLGAERWQWSLNSSARYRFAQHWEAALQYQHHLTGWPSKEEPFGGLSALQVGLRYYLR